MKKVPGIVVGGYKFVVNCVCVLFIALCVKSSFKVSSDKSLILDQGVHSSSLIFVGRISFHFNQFTVGNFGFLFNCTLVGRTSDSMTVLT